MLIALLASKRIKGLVTKWGLLPVLEIVSGKGKGGAQSACNNCFFRCTRTGKAYSKEDKVERPDFWSWSQEGLPFEVLEGRDQAAVAVRGIV